MLLLSLIIEQILLHLSLVVKRIMVGYSGLAQSSHLQEHFRHLVLLQVLLYSEILHKVDHYSVLVELVNVLARQNLVMLQHYLISTLHQHTLVTPTALYGTHLQVQVDYSVLMELQNLYHGHTTNHQLFHMEQKIMD